MRLHITGFLSTAEHPHYLTLAAEWWAQISQPPRPPGWNLPAGYCRFCAGEIREWNGCRHILRTNKTWHAWPDHPCQHLWRIAEDAAYARLQVFRRDLAVCSCCGRGTQPASPGLDYEGWPEAIADLAEISPTTPGWCMPFLGEWEVGHRVPLLTVDRAKSHALKYWMVQNLVTRCRACAQIPGRPGSI